MEFGSKTGMERKGGKTGKTLRSKLPDDIKEKPYLTRHVDTSIAILDSPENDIILEALLFLSKYVDYCLSNLNYLQQKGLLEKILNLFDRNICILRLCLRLLNILLTVEDVIYEFDQGVYDDHITRITDFYITHNDPRVKEFSVSILIKLANSCRITSLILSVDLLNPVLATLKTIKSLNLLQLTMALFDVLLTAPAAISVLPEMKNFDATVIIKFLSYSDEQVVSVAFNILSKLTLFGLDCYQTTFKKEKLVETMMEVIMNPIMKTNHDIAMQIILNCINSEVTSTYFVESLQFLQFCCWVKNCDPEYLRKCVDIFHKISAIPSIRQMLFDLSVEESILYFLRSRDKYILNRTCEAISNMSEHRYCCEHMLTGTVIETIYKILDRVDDEEDPQNNVAIKTLSNLTKRSLKTVHILNQLKAQYTFIDLFSKGLSAMSNESYQKITEMLYHFVVHPTYQYTVINSRLLKELLKVAQGDNEPVAILSTEMLTFCIANKKFARIFIAMDGPRIIVEEIKRTKTPKLLKSLLILIHCVLTNETIVMGFLKNGLVNVLKGFPESIQHRAPIITTILNLVFNVYLPFKFFETNRLSITDKLNNQFYLINGKWIGDFPFLDILRYEKVATILSIYVVDYTYEVKEPKVRLSSTLSLEDKNGSFSVKKYSTDSEPSINDSSSVDLTRAAYEINYGDLSPDPFLPRYIRHISKLFESEDCMIDKIRILANYIDTLLYGPDETLVILQKFHTFRLHIQSLKHKLGTNMIPIGYLRIGFHCERALLFKAIADRTNIPCSLIQGEHQIYWNEIALLQQDDKENEVLVFYVVDLMDNVGSLLAIGSKEAEQYCNQKNCYKSM